MPVVSVPCQFAMCHGLVFSFLHYSHIAFPIFPISFVLHPWSLIPLYTHTKQNKANRELSVVCLSVCEFLCLWTYFLKIICWEKCWKKRNSWKIIYFFKDIFFKVNVRWHTAINQHLLQTTIEWMWHSYDVECLSILPHSTPSWILS